VTDRTESAAAGLPGHMAFVNTVYDGIKFGGAFFCSGKLRGFDSQGFLCALSFSWRIAYILWHKKESSCFLAGAFFLNA